MMYYIIINKKQEGPFSKEEIVQKGIDKNSPIWHEGLPDWVKASDIPDFKSYFLSKPPTRRNPFTNIKYKGLYILTAVLILFISGRCLYKSNSSSQNNDTVTIEMLTKQNFEQQKMIEELQKELNQNIDKNRSISDREMRNRIEIQRYTLQATLRDTESRLDKAKANLADVEDIHLLRMPWEKEEQVQDAKNTILKLETEINRLKISINKLAETGY